MPRWNSLFYLLGDHLGSTNIVADANGAAVASMYYLPWGEERYANGTLNTTYRFTGQRQEEQLGGSDGL